MALIHKQDNVLDVQGELVLTDQPLCWTEREIFHYPARYDADNYTSVCIPLCNTWRWNVSSPRKMPVSTIQLLKSGSMHTLICMDGIITEGGLFNWMLPGSGRIK
jgi:hypothetical protein